MPQEPCAVHVAASCPVKIGYSDDTDADCQLMSAPPFFRGDPIDVFVGAREATEAVVKKDPQKSQTSVHVEHEIAACVDGPLAPQQTRNHAGKGGRNIAGKARKAVEKARKIAGKARKAAGKASNIARKLPLPRHLSFRVVIFFVISVACITAVMDFIFPEFVWWNSTVVEGSLTTTHGYTDLRPTMSTFPVVIFSSLFLPTAIYLVYRRNALLQRISKLRRLLPASRRYSSLTIGNVETMMEDGDLPARSSSTCSFATCCESASSDEETPSHEDEDAQLPLLHWLQPEIRVDLIAPWSTEQRAKVKEIAAFCAAPETKAVRATVTAFGHPEVCAWRFLRSSWDIETAKQRLRETAAWRAESLASRRGLGGGAAFHASGGELRVPATPASEKVFQKSRQLFPAVGWDGGVYDNACIGRRTHWWNARDGSPVEFWQIRLADAHEICSRFTQEELTDCYMEYNERRRDRVNELHAAGFLVIFDAAGFSFSHLRKAIRYAWRASMVLEMGEKHYPGSVRQVFVVNAPSFIYALYTAVQPVLGAATRSSVAITPNPPEEVPALMDLISPGILEEMRAVLN